jgi:hypothetical protein
LLMQRQDVDPKGSAQAHQRLLYDPMFRM